MKRLSGAGLYRIDHAVCGVALTAIWLFAPLSPYAIPYAQKESCRWTDKLLCYAPGSVTVYFPARLENKRSSPVRLKRSTSRKT